MATQANERARMGRRLVLRGLLLCVLFALVVLPVRFALAEGGQVHGEEGQGTVSRWGMLEEPWFPYVAAAAALFTGWLLLRWLAGRSKSRR